MQKTKLWPLQPKEKLSKFCNPFVIFQIKRDLSDIKMPKVRRNNKKQPPEGWELIEPTLEVYHD